MAIGTLKAGANSQDVTASTGTDVADTVNAVLDTNLQKFTPPDGFNTPSSLSNIQVFRNGDYFDCNIKPEDLIDFSQLANILYVDINRADDTGDGANWSTAFKGIGTAIDAAISAATPHMILVNEGSYENSFSTNPSSSANPLTAPLAIVAVNGRVSNGIFTSLAWTKTAAQDNVYETARSSSSTAIDLSVTDDEGAHKIYKRVTSISECNSTVGSWYSTSSIVYVHPFGSAAASDENVRVLLNGTGGTFEGNYNLYMYGIDFQGGNQGALVVSGGSTNNIVLENCTFRYAVNGNATSSQTPKDGINCEGAGLYAMYNCDASRNSKDGFNYHDEGAVIPDVLHVNCTGFNNGKIVGNSTSNNGFTTHDDIIAIDIGSKYTKSVGTNSGHINNGQVWSIGVIAGMSEGDTYNGGVVDWGAFGYWMGTGEMWLDSCTDVGSRIGVYAADGATVYVRNHTGTGLQSGNIESY